MRAIVVSLSEMQKLKGKLKYLNEEYLRLYEIMEDLNKEKEYLENLYMSKLGGLIFIKLEKEIEYRKLRKKITLIIQSENKGEEINIEKIEEILKVELDEFYKSLEDLREELNNSKIYMELPKLSSEEAKKIKEIFRKLAKRLHPDVNKNLCEESINLWIKVKEAYENNDLLSLIILDGLSSDKEVNEDIKINEIETNIKSLEMKIKSIKNIMKNEEEEFPLNIRCVIEDLDYINEKKKELTSFIKEYEKMIIKLEQVIEKALMGY